MFPVMEHQPQSTYLERKYAQSNMSRFYEVTIAPTLFGELSVVRRWGRIGAKGRTLELVFDDDINARDYSRRITEVKLKRGYASPPTNTSDG